MMYTTISTSKSGEQPAGDIRSRLLSLERLSHLAITSKGHQTQLFDQWSQLQQELPKQRLSDFDVRLLSKLSHNHRLLAEHMVQTENFLIDLLQQSQRERTSASGKH